MDGDEARVGQLEMSLYGTRDAGLNWSREVAETMRQMGFRRGRAATCNYHHVGRRIDVTVHGDDFFIVGSEEEIRWCIEEIKKRFEIKSTILGPESRNHQQLNFLNINQSGQTRQYFMKRMTSMLS